MSKITPLGNLFYEVRQPFNEEVTVYMWIVKEGEIVGHSGPFARYGFCRESDIDLDIEYYNKA